MGKLYIDGKEVLADVYMKGTWRAVGTVTMPAFTMGGTIDGAGQSIIDVGTYYTRSAFRGGAGYNPAIQTQTNIAGFVKLEGYGSGAYAEHARLAPNNFELLNGKLTGTLSANGTYTSHGIDFSGATQAAGDRSLIRAGSYGSPMDAAGEAQYGMVRLYLDTDDDGTSYNRGMFTCLKTSGTKGIFPVAGLAEVLAQSGNGPTQVGASQFISHLFTATSKVDARPLAGTANFYGAWLKVASVVDSEARSGSVVAPLWLDNQMNGTVNGEEYAAYITSGTIVDAVFGFEGTGGEGRWNNFLSFDSTCANLVPVVATGCTIAEGDTPYLKVDLDGTPYGIPLIAI